MREQVGPDGDGGLFQGDAAPIAIEIPKDRAPLGIVAPLLIVSVALVGIVMLVLPVNVVVGAADQKWGEYEVGCGSAFFPDVQDGIGVGMASAASREQLEEAIRRHDACNRVLDPRFDIGRALVGIAFLAGVVLFGMVVRRKGQQAAKRPSWKVDPSNRHQFRWWNGESWTDRVADAGFVSEDPIE